MTEFNPGGAASLNEAVKLRYEANADTNAFTNAEQTKLAGIEAAADVTDATNVTAAGALMDSEVTSLSGIKTLTVPDSTTITAAAATVLDDASVAAMTTTLGAARLDTAQVFTASQGITPVALTDAATIATDASLSNIFTVTLGGNRTLGNPTNLVAGKTYVWHITQDGTGSRLLSYASNFKFPGGTAPTLSTAAAAVDVIVGTAVSSTVVRCGAAIQDVK